MLFCWVELSKNVSILSFFCMQLRRYDCRLLFAVHYKFIIFIECVCFINLLSDCVLHTELENREFTWLLSRVIEQWFFGLLYLSLYFFAMQQLFSLFGWFGKYNFLTMKIILNIILGWGDVVVMMIHEPMSWWWGRYWDWGAVVWIHCSV